MDRLKVIGSDIGAETPAGFGARGMCATGNGCEHARGHRLDSGILYFFSLKFFTSRCFAGHQSLSVTKKLAYARKIF